MAAHANMVNDDMDAVCINGTASLNQVIIKLLWQLDFAIFGCTVRDYLIKRTPRHINVILPEYEPNKDYRQLYGTNFCFTIRFEQLRQYLSNKCTVRNLHKKSSKWGKRYIFTSCKQPHELVKVNFVANKYFHRKLHIDVNGMVQLNNVFDRHPWSAPVHVLQQQCQHKVFNVLSATLLELVWSYGDLNTAYNQLLTRLHKEEQIIKMLNANWIPQCCADYKNPARNKIYAISPSANNSSIIVSSRDIKLNSIEVLQEMGHLSDNVIVWLDDSHNEVDDSNCRTATSVDSGLALTSVVDCKELDTTSYDNRRRSSICGNMQSTNIKVFDNTATRCMICKHKITYMKVVYEICRYCNIIFHVKCCIKWLKTNLANAVSEPLCPKCNKPDIFIKHDVI